MKKLVVVCVATAASTIGPLACSPGSAADAPLGSGGAVDIGTGGSFATGGAVASGGGSGGSQVGETGGASGSGGVAAVGGTGGQGVGGSSTGGAGTGGASNDECEDTGAAESFSFFLTSYYHIVLLSGSDDGFGGDLRWNGATTGLQGADSICQEMARRVCHGDKTWKAFLSSSTENAVDRIGSGPWYDYAGELVADNVAGLTSGDRPAGGACDEGTFDEIGTFHDGSSDVNDDGMGDDDHDTLTSTNADGTYSGFSCEDWTSTTALPPAEEGGPGGPGGLSSAFPMGHCWPAQSGQSWLASHGGHGCQPGTNFIQDGPGSGESVGAGGGYGAFYCFAMTTP